MTSWSSGGGETTVDPSAGVPGGRSMVGTGRLLSFNGSEKLPQLEQNASFSPILWPQIGQSIETPPVDMDKLSILQICSGVKNLTKICKNTDQS